MATHMYTCKHCGNTSLAKSRRCTICGSRMITSRQPRRFHQLTEHIFYEIVEQSPSREKRPEEQALPPGFGKRLGQLGQFWRETLCAQRFAPAAAVKRASARLKSRMTRQQWGFVLSLCLSLGISLLVSFLLL